MPAHTVALSLKHIWVKRHRIKLWPLPVQLGRITLADAGLTASPGQLVAIIGPNGAGKTTLLRTIAGERPQRGAVLLNGQSLYQPGGPEYWLPKIGYVPVDSVLHEQLTVRQALAYIAELRLPDTPRAERQKRIDEWLGRLGIEQRRHQRLSTLSSGERKKVTICAELLTDPMLLLLDEPTSNLDPNAELELMGWLRNLAEQHSKTIVVVTHTLSTLHLCHEVAFVANGQVLAQAPPAQLLAQLDPREAASNGGTYFERWAGVFAQHQTSDRSGQPLPRTAPAPANNRMPAPHAVDSGRQFRVLLRRAFALQLNAPLQLIFRLLLGCIGGLFLFVLPADSFIRNRGDNIDINDARTAFFLIGLVIALVGMISSFQEISREWRLYHHERMKGLSIWAYLISKWVSLGAVVGLIAPALLIVMLVFFQRQPLQPSGRFASDDSVPGVHGVVLAAQMPWFTELTAGLPIAVRAAAVQLNLEALISLTLACLAAITLGLLLSAVARSDGMATLLLAMAVIFHVFMSGLSNNKQLEWLIDRLSVFAASYWAVRGFSVSGAVYCWSPPQFKDFYSLGYLGSIWLALLAYVLAALLAGYLALRMRDGWVAWHWSLRQALRNRAVLALLLVLLACVSWSAFLRARSWDYYALQDGDAVVRIDTLPLGPVNMLQLANGWISQAQCPMRVQPRQVPTVAVPAVGAAPTPAALLPVGTAVATLAPPPSPIATADPTPSPAATSEATATPRPAATSEAAATPPPTAPPDTPGPVVALPEGRVIAETSLRFGPQHDSFAALPAGSRFMLLARDSRSNWLRVLWRNAADGRALIGWVEADQTDADPRNTSTVAVPPHCARPIGLISHQTAQWQNQAGDRGTTALVIDVFRSANGSSFPGASVEVLVNDTVVRQIPVSSTRGSFLLPRYTVSDLPIKSSDSVAVRVAQVPPDQMAPEFFGMLFLVPSGCSFQ